LECEIGLAPVGFRVCRAGELVDSFECEMPYGTVFAGIAAGMAVCCMLFFCAYTCRKTGCCCGHAEACGFGGDGGSSGVTRRTVVAPKKKKPMRSEASVMIMNHVDAEEQLSSKIEEDRLKHEQNTQKRLAERRSSRIQADAEALALSTKETEAAKAEADRIAAEAADIENARTKLTGAMEKRDVALIALVLDDLSNDGQHVVSALAENIAAAKALRSSLEAEMGEAKRQEILNQRTETARKELEKVLQSVDSPQGLLEARRHVHALQNDADLSKALAADIQRGKDVITKQTSLLKSAILKEISDAMADSTNPKQYQRLKASIEAFDGFDPSMAAPTNEELMVAARAMLDKLYEVYKLKLLLAQLDNKAIAQLKSMNQPVDDVTNVVKAMLILLGEDSKSLKEWKACRVNISRTGRESLKRRVDSFRIEMCTDKVTKQVKRLLASINLDRVEDISPTVAIFYAFVQGALALDDRLDAKKGGNAAGEDAAAAGGGSGAAAATVGEQKESASEPPPPPPPPPPPGPAGGGFGD
jgi:hypothetical protein